MSRKNRQRKQESRAAQPLPYRFILPRDLEIVKIWAYAYALETAYIMVRDRPDLQPFAVDSLPINASLLLEQATYNGLQGTNDPALYHETFTGKFSDMYPIAYEALNTGQLVVDAALPELERLALFYRQAEQAMASRN